MLLQERSSPVNNLYGFMAVLFAGLIFYGAVLPLMAKDFWYDEVVSLEQFILVPLKKTVTDYPYPNNHIFFSILMNLWCKLWGITIFAEAADNILTVRLLPLLISITSVFAVYITGRRMGGTIAGWTAALALAAMLPFTNYAVQVRGYGLTILLVALLANYVFLLYKSPRPVYGIVVAVLTALLLYTIPSNLYPVLAMGAVCGGGCILVWVKQGAKPATRSALFKTGIWLFAGIALALLLYLPVVNSVVNNDYVKAGEPFRPQLWAEAAKILRYLVMPLYITVVLIAAGLIVGLVKRKNLQVPLVIGLVIALPFFISYIRGDQPFDRTFLWICPLLAILAGGLSAFAFNSISNGRLKGAALGITLILLYANISAGEMHSSGRLLKRLRTENPEWDMYFNNIRYEYHTHKNLGEFKKNHYSDSTPVFLYDVDKYAMHGYLPIHGINWEPFPEKIKSVSKYFIITPSPKKAVRYYRQIDSGFRFEAVNQTMDLVTIVKAERIDN